VSSDIPEYTEIVAEILRRDVGEVSVHTLSAQSSSAHVVDELAVVKPDRIVAVGLSAAIAMRGLRDTPMVFCQVYNYQDHALLSPTSKGVDLLPPFELQFRAWRKLAQDVRHIGVITGPGQEALLAEMEHAAASFDIDLAVRIVSSDREALHEFRTLAPMIDGLWLLPDNRILSPNVVREIFSYGAEHGKKIATFGDNLLKMGALLSLRSDPRDVVDRVLERLESIDGNGRLPGPDMVALTALYMQVNADVAKRFGLGSAL
jgi:ABC-type uncharacterized transport system substrate-binding protein